MNVIMILILAVLVLNIVVMAIKGLLAIYKKDYGKEILWELKN